MITWRGTMASLVLASATALITGVLSTPPVEFLAIGPVGNSPAASAQAYTASDAAYAVVGNPGQSSVAFLPGTGNPGEKASVYPGQEYVVPYPAATPVVDNYADSVVRGAASTADAVRALPGGSSVVLSGYSQGAHAARVAAVQPGVVPDYAVTVVTIADPCTEQTGILVRFAIAQAATGVPCAPIPDGAQGVVINRADDPIANFPADLNGVTAANALAEYLYYHAHGYGPVDLNQTDVRSYTVGNVTYVTIPRDRTPALVRWARDSGIPVSPEAEQWVADATYRPDPGPAGWGADPSPAPLPLYDAAASVAGPDLVADTWQHAVVEPFAQAASNWSTPVAAPAPVSAADNVAAIADTARAWLPPESAPVVDQIAASVQNSPLGDWMNSLPRL